MEFSDASDNGIASQCDMSQQSSPYAQRVYTQESFCFTPSPRPVGTKPNWGFGGTSPMPIGKLDFSPGSAFTSGGMFTPLENCVDRELSSGREGGRVGKGAEAEITDDDESASELTESTVVDDSDSDYSGCESRSEDSGSPTASDLAFIDDDDESVLERMDRDNFVEEMRAGLNRGSRCLKDFSYAELGKRKRDYDSLAREAMLRAELCVGLQQLRDETTASLQRLGIRRADTVHLNDGSTAENAVDLTK